jgi:hypothetical protein
MPSSIAALASGAGASDAAVAISSATNIRPPQRYGRSSTSRPRSLRPRPLRPRQAAAQLGEGGAERGPHQPRHLALERLAREEHLVGQALLDDLAVQLGRSAARRACRARRRPSSSTTISSASAIVDRRCAMTIVVRPAITSRSASLISCSVVASTDEVASSRIRMRGSARKRARDRDALALAARERQAALADARVVAVGQALDELVRLRAARGLLDLLVGRVRRA